MTSTDIGRSRAVGAVTLTGKLSERVNVFADYQVEAGARTTSQTGSLGVRVAW